MKVYFNITTRDEETVKVLYSMQMHSAAVSVWTQTTFQTNEQNIDVFFKETIVFEISV